MTSRQQPIAHKLSPFSLMNCHIKITCYSLGILSFAQCSMRDKSGLDCFFLFISENISVE